MPQTRREKWTEFTLFTHWGGFPVPNDAATEAVGVWEVRGLARFEDGDVAKMKALGSMRLKNGLGAYAGFALYSFPDGAAKLARIEGQIYELTQDGGNLQRGSLVYERGLGRFAGISGEGSFTARQYGPPDEGGESVIEVEADCALPD